MGKQNVEGIQPIQILTESNDKLFKYENTDGIHARVLKRQKQLELFSTVSKRAGRSCDSDDVALSW